MGDFHPSGPRLLPSKSPCRPPDQGPPLILIFQSRWPHTPQHLALTADTGALHLDISPVLGAFKAGVSSQ